MVSTPRLLGVLAVLAFVLHDARAGSAPGQEPNAAAKPAGTGVELHAHEGAGGNVLTLKDGTKAVTLDSSCKVAYPKTAGCEWKLATPLTAGWWRGTVNLTARETEGGYTNTAMAVAMLSPQAPTASLYVNGSAIHGAPKEPQHFDFWFYAAQPVPAVRLQPTYSDLYLYKRTWPVTRITFEPVQPVNLGADEVVILDLEVNPDGAISLPPGLPPGNWRVKGKVGKSGTVTLQTVDKRTIVAAVTFDIWHRVQNLFIHATAALQQGTFKADPPLKAMLLEHNVTRPQTIDFVSNVPAATVVDSSKTESAQLELSGTDLTGEAPTFPLLPMGRKAAVLTTWDDGTLNDIRCAEILQELGYHGSFFMNQHSPMMKSLDKLEALGMEVGSHCYHHPMLFMLPPASALDECLQMRKLLEQTLKHPVISMAYPDGYTPAYDSEGDYVLRAVRTAGFWSARTTDAGTQTVDSFQEPLAFKIDNFFGDRAGLIKKWEKVRTTEGCVFHVWGHSHQIGKTDEEWKAFKDFMAHFARQPDTWYPTQGEFFTWLWLRKNVQVAVTGKAPTKVIASVSRPWLHPYIAGKCPVSLKLPAGVPKAVWQGKDIPVVNGCVELPWGN